MSERLIENENGETKLVFLTKEQIEAIVDENIKLGMAVAQEREKRKNKKEWPKEKE
jgi:hypothetical protein